MNASPAIATPCTAVGRPTVLDERVRRLIAAALAMVLVTVALMRPAGATTPVEDGSQGSVQYAAAVAGPSTVYLETYYDVWVIDHNGEYLNDGHAYELTYRCSGFVVDGDGYIATAGHCVDPSEARRDALIEAAYDAFEQQLFVYDDGTPASFGDLYDAAMSSWQVEGTDVGSPPEADVWVDLGAGGHGEEILPARVIDFYGIDDGDVALLKVNATDLPAVELLGDAGVHVGTEVVSVGYPASSDDVVDATGGPTFKDGRISSEKTRGNGLLPVFEISAAVSGGMSGGPTVDGNGRVIGINSFKIVGEEQQFNFVSPAGLLQELLDRSGVDAGLTTADTDYRTGVAALLAGECRDAAAMLEAVMVEWPEHRVAESYLDDARRCAETQPEPTPEPSAEPSPTEDPDRTPEEGPGDIGIGTGGGTDGPTESGRMQSIQVEAGSNGIPLWAPAALAIALVMMAGGAALHRSRQDGASIAHI